MDYFIKLLQCYFCYFLVLLYNIVDQVVGVDLILSLAAEHGWENGLSSYDPLPPPHPHPTVGQEKKGIFIVAPISQGVEMCHGKYNWTEKYTWVTISFRYKWNVLWEI